MIASSVDPAVRRRTLLKAAAVPVGLTPAAALVGCGDDQPAVATEGDAAPDEVTYLTAFGITPREAFVHVAAAKGYFAEVNIEVTVEAGAAGDANHQTLASGAAQFAAVDSSGALIRYGRAATAAAEGGDDTFQIVAAVHQLPLMAFLSFAELGIENPRDLEGRTVGLAAGSIAETLWPVYAELAGVDPAAVETVPTSPQTQVQEWAGGRLDAIAQFGISKPSLVAAGGGREVAALAWSDVISDLYGNAVVAPKSVIDSRPDLVERFVTALMRGLEYTVEHPEEAGELLVAADPTQDAEVAAAELTLMAPYVLPVAGEPVGVLRPDRVTRAASLLQSTGAVPGASGLAYEQDIIAWSFVPGADEAEVAAG